MSNEPGDVYAEQMLIGATLNSPKLFLKVDFIIPEAFSSEMNGEVWRTIVDMGEFDTESLFSVINARGIKISFDGYEGIHYLEYCKVKAVSSLRIENHANTVWINYMKRLGEKLLNKTRVNLSQVDQTHKPEDILDLYMSSVSEMYKAYLDSKPRKRTRTLKEVTNSIVNRLDTKMAGKIGDNIIPTGLTELDNLLDGGLESGRIHLISGTRGGGKSEFAINLVNSAINHFNKNKIEKHVFIFTLEMSAEEYAQRLIQMRHGLPARPFVNPKGVPSLDYQKARGYTVDFNANIIVDDAPGITVSHIKSVLNYYISMGIEPGLLLVDQLGLMTPEDKRKNGNVYTDRDETLKALKIIAVDYDIPEIVLEQHKKLTTLSDLINGINLTRYGAEEHADVVYYPYRETLYNPSSIKVGLLTVRVCKNRQSGHLDSVDVFRDSQSGALKDMVSPNVIPLDY